MKWTYYPAPARAQVYRSVSVQLVRTYVYMYIRTYVVVIQRASTLYLARSGRRSDSALIIQEGEPVVRVPAIPTRQHRRRNPPGQSRTPYAESHDKRPYVYAPYSTEHCSVIDSPTLSFLLFDYNNRPPVRLCTLSAAYFKRFPSIWRLAYMYIICTTHTRFMPSAKRHIPWMQALSAASFPSRHYSLFDTAGDCAA